MAMVAPVPQRLALGHPVRVVPVPGCTIIVVRAGRLKGVAKVAREPPTRTSSPVMEKAVGVAATPVGVPIPARRRRVVVTNGSPLVHLRMNLNWGLLVAIVTDDRRMRHGLRYG